MMKFLYYLGVLCVIGVGAASLFFHVQLPFNGKLVVASIYTSIITLDMVVFSAGIVMLVMGFLLGTVNN